MSKGTSNNTVIHTENLTRDYMMQNQTIRAVNNVNIKVNSGEFVTFMGRSGSGKTTLLNLISGLDNPTKGKVFFDGQDIHKISEKQMMFMRRNKLGIIFQSFSLLPLLSAYENVELPLRISGVKGLKRKRRSSSSI